MSYNFQTGENKINLLMEYKNLAQNVLFDDVLAALIYGRKYDIIPRNGDCSRESNVRSMVFLNKVRYQNSASI
jgi:hypothetical protein